MVVVVVPAVAIAVFVFVPAVVVLEAAAVSVPIAREVLLAVVVWRDPVRARVRRAGPVAGVPLVVLAVRVPIALHPDEVRPRARRHLNNPGRRGRANSDPERNLGARCCGAQHREGSDQKQFPYRTAQDPGHMNGQRGTAPIHRLSQIAPPVPCRLSLSASRACFGIGEKLHLINEIVNSGEELFRWAITIATIKVFVLGPMNNLAQNGRCVEGAVAQIALSRWPGAEIPEYLLAPIDFEFPAIDTSIYRSKTFSNVF
jgi:hypothetical protein